MLLYKFRHRPSQIRTSCSCFRRSTALGRAWDPKVVSGKSLFCQLPLSTQCRNMYNKIEEEPTVLYIYYIYIISHRRVSAVRIVRKFTNH